MSDFNVTNCLEQALLDAQAGDIPPSKLFEVLYASQVFVLVDKELPSDGAWSNEIALLVLSSQTGVPVIAVFTAPERAIGWPEQAPSFKFGLLTDFRWLLKGIAYGAGIVINPGSAVGLELAPAIVQKLKESAGLAGAPTIQ